MILEDVMISQMLNIEYILLNDTARLVKVAMGGSYGMESVRPVGPKSSQM